MNDRSCAPKQTARRINDVTQNANKAGKMHVKKQFFLSKNAKLCEIFIVEA